MSALLHRLGKWCAHRAKTVLGAWFALIGILAALIATTGLNLTDAFKIDNAESIQGMEVLQERLPQAAGTSNQVLFSTDTGTILDYQEEIAEFISTASTIDGISMVTDPFSELTPSITENKKHALLQIMGDKSVGSQMSGPTIESATTAQALKELVTTTAAENPELQIDMAENIGHFISVPLSLTELIGVGIAALVLIATFGLVLAAGAPILSAFIGVGAGMLVVLGVANFVEINSTTPALAVMIGLAVGIDYALFIIARAREYILDGVAPREAAARANATAGSSVVFAGGTVIVALCGLSVSGIGFLAVMGISAAFVVFISVLVAITAVPAMLGLIGMKAISRKQRQKQRTRDSQNTQNKTTRRSPAVWWISTITKAPLVTIFGVVAILGLMLVPATKMTTALTDNGTEPLGTSLRTTYDKIGEYYGDGYNAPIIVIADIVQSTEPVELVNKLSQEISQIDGVKKIQLATPNPDASIAFVQIIPEHGQTDARTAQLVQDLRTSAPIWETDLKISDVMITGATAVSIDIAEQLNSALIPFGIVVVGLSLILLMIVFRSIAVPLTATIGYLLSLGAAFGAIGIVYGYGIGADLLHVTKTGPVISFLPVMVMGILFGLAMDYQVFLVSRMREEWIRSGNAMQAVKQGFIGSSTVVVAAALIMTSVFAAFIPEGSVQIKPIAIG
ncbi:MAG: MMPL family transporter, partial [Arcanobacterium sp.]|nr:MMPL family transporter [Arcanobacterium sp.]